MAITAITNNKQLMKFNNIMDTYELGLGIATPSHIIEFEFTKVDVEALKLKRALNSNTEIVNLINIILNHLKNNNNFILQIEGE